MIYNDSVTLNGQVFEVVESINEDWGYDWHDGAIYRDADGQLYWYEDSGCSCSYFGEDLNSVDDLTPIANWQEAVELAKADFPEAQVFEFASRLNNG